MNLPSKRKHRSKKRRLHKTYVLDYLRLARLAAVRDLGDRRRWGWTSDPASIGREPDTFEPVTSDDYARYEGHFEFHPREGRVWVVDREFVRGSLKTIEAEVQPGSVMNMSWLVEDAPCKPSRFIIEEDFDSFEVLDLRVGKDSQFPDPRPRPGNLFHPQLRASAFKPYGGTFDAALLGAFLTSSVMNVTSEPRKLRCRWECEREKMAVTRA